MGTTRHGSEDTGPATYHIETFGCQMNVYDSDWLARALQARGMTPAPMEEARVVIVNTCSVREKPEQKVYSILGRIREFFDRDGRVFAAVGGCVAQQIGKGFFNRFPHVRLVFGTDNVGAVPDAVEKLLAEPRSRLCLTETSAEYLERPIFAQPDKAPAQTSGPAAFVTIMQGCDNFCAYCIVPYVRGRQKSRTSRAVLEECRALVENGVREITLLGQNVNAFGLDKHGDGVGFHELLTRVAAIPGLARLRFTTSHPKDLAPEVIRAFGELEVLCPQLHLPMQAGSDKILKAMGRRYDMARYRELVKGLKQARPDISLTTDIIVGFPGETDEDFELTLNAVEELGFESSFSFVYNDRPGVRAEKMENKVEPGVKSARLARLQEMQTRRFQNALKAMKGREVDVLLEAPGRRRADELIFTKGVWRGRDPYNHVVNVTLPRADQTDDAASGPGNEGDLTGKLVKARIIEAKKHSLVGEGSGEPW